MKTNYQKELDTIIEHVDITLKPRLLIHSCCAPCSSYCLEYLCKYFDITVLYYNPNITDSSEYDYRLSEQKRLIDCLNERYQVNIRFAKGEYEPDKFIDAVKGYEDCPEGGDRCKICFALRLSETASMAKEEGYDYFTTTLTISPLKNADVLNDIGNSLGEKYGVSFLPSDFKKKNGYKRSTELSKEYGLYRQNYCGCEFSKREALARDNKDRT